MKTRAVAFKRDGIIGSFLTGFDQARLDELATIWINKGVKDLQLVEVDLISYVGNDGELVLDYKNERLVQVYKKGE